MFSNGFGRYQGSLSAKNATIQANNNFASKDLEYYNTGSLEEEKVVNNPEIFESDSNNFSVDSQLEEGSGPLSSSNGKNDSKKSGDRVVPSVEKCEKIYTNGAVPVLSTSYSSISSTNVSDQINVDKYVLEQEYTLHPTNSQRIDNWCLKNEVSIMNELAEQKSHAEEFSHKHVNRYHNALQSWNSAPIPNEIASNVRETNLNANTASANQRSSSSKLEFMERLSKRQLEAAKQFIKELLPFLKTCRRTHFSTSYPSRYNDIPSVFPNHDLILACSIDFNLCENEGNQSDCRNAAASSGPMKLLYFPNLSPQEFVSETLDDNEFWSSSARSTSWLSWTFLPRFFEYEM